MISPQSTSIQPEPILERESLRLLAVSIGFTEAGLVALPQVTEDRDAERFGHWIQAGRAGSMRYLERTDETGQLIRSRVSIPFAWARSAIVCFANYHSAQPRSTDLADPTPGPSDKAWIARYAWSSRKDEKGVVRPSDYHKVLKKHLVDLETSLHQQFGEFESRAYVDTGPVVERVLATSAGLGWTGKNTCLIHPRLGSYGFLAVLLTSLEVKQPDTSLTVPDRCGTCRRCIEACPTDALIAPYQMDATRCISYLTIEHRGPIEPSLMQGMGRQVFGCDICQDVCPWNRKAPIATDPALQPRAELVNPSLDWLADLRESDFEQLFNGSPVRRAGFNGLRRNIAIAMGNSGLPAFAARLENWSNAADHGLRSAAQWALAHLRNRANALANPEPATESQQLIKNEEAE